MRLLEENRLGDEGCDESDAIRDLGGLRHLRDSVHHGDHGLRESLEGDLLREALLSETPGRLKGVRMVPVLALVLLT